MPKVPSLSSKALAKLLETGGAVFVRQGPTDHAIYALKENDTLRLFRWARKHLTLFTARVLRQLQFTDEEIERVLTK